MKLAGKVALVTGGGRGIGRGVVEVLVREGARVAIAEADRVVWTANQYWTKEIAGYQAAKALAAELVAQGAEVIAIEADVTKVAEVKAMVAATLRKWGRLDILVNAAGVITVNPVEALTEDEWDSIMDTNVKGTFLCCQVVLAQMKQQGGGRIVNFASIAGKEGAPGLPHYCASKFAVVGFTNSLAKEVARDNISVNAVCPGVVPTQMWVLLRRAYALPGESEDESYRRTVERLIPQGVDQTAADMGEAVLFLVTNDHITGQALNVDGGARLF
ncbi:MAG: SDR family oxidoreductase [Firmicutes bacterium]|jgi:meso-butanediol dehydrogenase/(S,S)-butanediol dehydrogenase/diacetyl reductase|nr:SDR family oxidoreductase [Bacillota bacterium]